VETIEYRTIDKSAWTRGPWDDEPDKRQWQDAETGLPCLIVRNRLGALCGYVGVAPGHPAHGQHYDSVEADVHGGLTFSHGCSGGEESSGICHKAAEGEPDHVWWFGFDCAHSCDLSPHPQATWTHDRDNCYRDVAYVAKQVASLAKQLHAIRA